jgi:hypothetical protein
LASDSCRSDCGRADSRSHEICPKQHLDTFTRSSCKPFLCSGDHVATLAIGNQFDCGKRSHSESVTDKSGVVFAGALGSNEGNNLPLPIRRIAPIMPVHRHGTAFLALRDQ